MGTLDAARCEVYWVERSDTVSRTGEPASIGLVLTAAATTLLVGCTSDAGVVVASDAGAPILRVESTTSASICRLEGPALAKPGVYGTDLGFTFTAPKAQGG